jgi:hypothetical protein
MSKHPLDESAAGIGAVRIDETQQGLQTDLKSTQVGGLRTT